MTIEETEQRISEIYRHLTSEVERVVGSRPVRLGNAYVPEYTTVRIQETGELAALWAVLATEHPEEYPHG